MLGAAIMLQCGLFVDYVCQVKVKMSFIVVLRESHLMMVAIVILMCQPSWSADGKTTLLEMPVPVVTSADPSIFPETWRRGRIQATGKAIEDADFERASRVIATALSKYPDEVLRQHLKCVYVLSELKYSGVTASGTNSLTAVYVKIGDPKNGFSDAWIERVFHAEFSSILFRNRPKGLDSEAWKMVNPSGFTYLGNGVDAIKQRKSSTRPDATLHSQGFIAEYSQSTLENDFNGFAAAIFMGQKEVWRMAETHPKIAEKLKLTLAFYNALDPALTETSFRALVPE